jgi:predicted RecB family endonuclease
MALMTLRDLLNPHERIVSSVEKVLREESWQVEREPVLENIRPDLVAHAPDGATYVIEVKQGRLDANLGAVAQVEAFQNMANDRYPGAKGVLVVAGTAPENRGELDTAAHGAGVDVVWTSSSGVGSIRESLQSAGVMNGGAVIGGTQAAHQI